MKIYGRLAMGLIGAAALLGGSHAHATTVDFSGGGGPATLDFSNYESFGNLNNGQIQVGTTNYGTFEVTAATVAGNGIYTPSSTGYLVGVFSGITVASIGNGGTTTGNSGGTFSIYLVTAAELATKGLTIGNLFAQGTGGYAAGGCSVNTQCYNGITNVGGTDIINFDLVPGGDAAGDTLVANINATSVPLTGSATAFADITGGVDADEFLKDVYTTAIGTKADLNISDEFCPGGSGGRCVKVGDWSDDSFDPVTGNVVPEPGSLALIGSQLVGLGAFIGWRRKRRGAQATAA